MLYKHNKNKFNIFRAIKASSGETIPVIVSATNDPCHIHRFSSFHSIIILPHLRLICIKSADLINKLIIDINYCWFQEVGIKEKEGKC
jgi:hypothetical protein